MRQSDSEQAYLDTVCNQVRWHAAHQPIREELAEHMEDQKEAFVAAGLGEEAAQAKTLEEMGEPESLGLLFDASYRPKATWGVFVPILLFALLGVVFRVFVYQMTGALAWRNFLIAAGVGVFGGVLLLRANFYRLARSGWVFYFLVVAVCLGVPAALSALSLWQVEHTGTDTMLQYAWMLFPLAYALVVYRLRGLGFLGIVLAVILMAAPLLASTFVFWSGYYIEALAFFSCIGVLIGAIWKGVFACNRWIALSVILLGLLLAAALFLIIEPYRVSRFLSIVDPARDPEGAGWLVLRIRELLAHSALIGAGDRLPTISNEVVARFGAGTAAQGLLLAVVAYRYGLIAAALPVAGLLAWLIYGIHRARRIGSALGKLLATCVLMIFGMETVLSIAVFLGYPLWYSAVFPFLTDNSLLYVMNLLLAGVLASVLRTDGLFTDTPYRKRKLRLRLEVR